MTRRSSPQPTLTGLDALLVQAKGGGARLTVEGNPRALPAGVELSAYRIVEQLLDALQDAPGVEVCVRFRDEALELVVSGPASRRSKAGDRAGARAGSAASRHARRDHTRRASRGGGLAPGARGV